MVPAMLLRRAATCSAGLAMQTVEHQVRPKLCTARPLVMRSFATTKSASPETPLMHYTATQQATSSINHRLFYVNVAALVFIVDAGSAMIDL
mmetsp:Transcript_37211/g.73729  ORF Transcript_37211/g.73729 Transcript_37211/m.73729 type:complete len:92 (-) Transcript_37211:35-310(-)